MLPGIAPEPKATEIQGNHDGVRQGQRATSTFPSTQRYPIEIDKPRKTLPGVRKRF